MVAQAKSITSADDVFNIPLSLLELGDKNVRRRDITADIDQLAKSIQTFGLQQPIVVQPRNGMYEIIIGQRRYLAVKRLGLDRIKARIITKPLDEFESKVISFSENIQRRDLAPRDKADTCSYLLKKLHTPRAVAEHLGVTEQTVRKWLQYAEVPETLKKLVDRNKISSREASSLYQFSPDEEKAVKVAQKMVELGLAKRHRERVISSLEESPNSSTDAIFHRAEQKRYEKEIRFILPEKWSLAIDKASARLRETPGDLARNATIEWLQMLKY